MKARSALTTRNTAIKNGFLSNKINELKKNKTKDSSWTRISMLKSPLKHIAHFTFKELNFSYPGVGYK